MLSDYRVFSSSRIPSKYETRTHHSNMDAYDRAQPGDLMQAVVVIASFVYHAANREEKLPRKPLPEPLPTMPEQVSAMTN